jgi:molecular chaperone DnaK (HSP70)
MWTKSCWFVSRACARSLFDPRGPPAQIGGSTRIPKLQEMLSEMLLQGDKPSVAGSAAGGSKKGKKKKGGAGATSPAAAAPAASESKRELCKSVNPDEAVAVGAAIQAAILSGNAKSAKDSKLGAAPVARARFATQQ